MRLVLFTQKIREGQKYHKLQEPTWKENKKRERVKLPERESPGTNSLYRLNTSSNPSQYFSPG